MRIKDRLTQVEIDYAEADKAIQNGTRGADRWYEGLDKEIKRLRELVQILLDPTIPNGSQIKLKGGDYSHLRRVINSKVGAELLENVTRDGILADAARRLRGETSLSI